MNNPNVRGVVVAVILLAGVLWVLQGKKVAADAQSNAAAPDAGRVAASGTAVTDTTAPFAKQIADDAPILQFIRSHPSPLGDRISAALKGDKAAVLVGLPAGKPDPQLAGWHCTDYCKTMADRIDLAPPGKGDEELLKFLAADTLKLPFLAGISPSGEVTKRESGKLERKQVIGVFADVTGSCGVTCEGGECK
ncbi:MAG: hypothetical protein HYU66_05835 [Armatimonadetes bacterium]|nr:hypothetical protein [Armatimonadota bacterium]